MDENAYESVASDNHDISRSRESGHDGACLGVNPAIDDRVNPQC